MRSRWLCLVVAMLRALSSSESIPSDPIRTGWYRFSSVKDKINITTSNDSASKPCRSVVSFVNGIYHSYPELQKIARSLEEIFAEEVRVFYNPSTGNWFSDAYRAGVELIYKPNDLIIAQSLANHLRKALKDVGANGESCPVASFYDMMFSIHFDNY